VRSPAQRISREVEKTLFVGSFEVSRLLPGEGQELRYRLKNTLTGHERIAAETEITSAETPES
jgi:hypothetical protein